MSKKYIASAIVVLAGFMGSYSAQAQVNLKSISVGASYWQPSLDYWNDRSFLTAYNNGSGAKFSGQVIPTAAIEIGIAKNLSVGGRVGYYKSSASSSLVIGGITRTEDFSISIIPVALDLKYTFAQAPAPATTTGTTTTQEKPKDAFLTPYIGVSVARYFINNELNRVVVANPGTLSEKQSGNSYGVQVFVGAEKKLVKMLYAALDVRYHLGSYNQLTRTETTSTTEKVSLNGVEAGLSLRLKFNN
ncbi:hypothetical protein [uncultured Fibrella sp.]|uniref:hypothetical protein n=1 Tax=uncultured Fibrella sp. TaxID=1284596 RepID=UPI0035C96D6F